MEGCERRGGGRMKSLVMTLCFVLALGIVVALAVASERLQVVATTTIVGDVVRSVAGDHVELVVLLPRNADPHTFQPTPRDVVTVSNADVVFISGAGLEEEVGDILDNAASRIVDLSERVVLRELGVESAEASAEDEDTLVGEGESDDGRHDHGEHDPHVWFDPANVTIWTETIEEALAELDPENAAFYRSNASSYRLSLNDLDRWIRDEIDRVPLVRRRLVTDHLAFGYFAARYGFEQVGSVFAGFSTLAEPSAREMAELIDAIETLDVPAIFVGTTADPTLAEAIAADTGTDVVTLYTGSLSEQDGPAATYLEFMRYDVLAIVDALAR